MSSIQRIHPWLYDLYMRSRVATTFRSKQTYPRHGDEVMTASSNYNPEKFFYDGQRSKWLSVDTRILYFSTAASASGYLYITGGQQSSGTLGYLLEYDCTLCEMWLLRDATGALETYRLTANGTDKAQTSFNSVGDTKSYNYNLNINFSLGDIVGCRLLSGSTVGQTVVAVRFRRRDA